MSNAGDYEPAVEPSKQEQKDLRDKRDRLRGKWLGRDEFVDLYEDGGSARASAQTLAELEEKHSQATAAKEERKRRAQDANEAATSSRDQIEEIIQQMSKLKTDEEMDDSVDNMTHQRVVDENAELRGKLGAANERAKVAEEKVTALDEQVKKREEEKAKVEGKLNRWRTWTKKHLTELQQKREQLVDELHEKYKDVE